MNWKFWKKEEKKDEVLVGDEHLILDVVRNVLYEPHGDITKDEAEFYANNYYYKCFEANRVNPYRSTEERIRWYKDNNNKIPYKALLEDGFRYKIVNKKDVLKDYIDYYINAFKAFNRNTEYTSKEKHALDPEYTVIINKKYQYKNEYFLNVTFSDATGDVKYTTTIPATDMFMREYVMETADKVREEIKEIE